MDAASSGISTFAYVPTVLFWLVGVGLLGLGAARRGGRGRMFFAAAALAHFVAGPLGAVMAWSSVDSFAATFGAEAMGPQMFALFAPAMAVGSLLIAIASGLVALAPRGGAPDRPASA